MNAVSRFKAAWGAIDAHLKGATWGLLKSDTSEAKTWHEKGHRLADDIRDAESDLLDAVGGKPLTDGYSSKDYDAGELIDDLYW